MLTASTTNSKFFERQALGHRLQRLVRGAAEAGLGLDALELLGHRLGAVQRDRRHRLLEGLAGAQRGGHGAERVAQLILEALAAPRWPCGARGTAGRARRSAPSTSGVEDAEAERSATSSSTTSAARLDGDELRRAHGHVGALEQDGDLLEVGRAAERALTACRIRRLRSESPPRFSLRSTTDALARRVAVEAAGEHRLARHAHQQQHQPEHDQADDERERESGGAVLLNWRWCRRRRRSAPRGRSGRSCCVAGV